MLSDNTCLFRVFKIPSLVNETSSVNNTNAGKFGFFILTWKSFSLSLELSAFIFELYKACGRTVCILHVEYTTPYTDQYLLPLLEYLSRSHSNLPNRSSSASGVRLLRRHLMPAFEIVNKPVFSSLMSTRVKVEGLGKRRLGNRWWYNIRALCSFCY